MGTQEHARIKDHRSSRLSFCLTLDPVLRYQCSTVTPVFNAVHKRHTSPHGIGCVIEDYDLKRLVRCLNGDGHAVQDMSDGLHILVPPGGFFNCIVGAIREPSREINLTRLVIYDETRNRTALKCQEILMKCERHGDVV